MKTYCLELEGDYACFTCPEMKVERVSYDVMTPSAARACFEAILWKRDRISKRPAIRWHIRKIEVLNPIRWINLRRNEVASVVSARNVETAMKTGKSDLGLYIEEDRQQRAGLFLRNVAYRVYADQEFLHEPDPDATPRKYQEMFERRASKGQCVNQPYLGCREFAAAFRLITQPEAEPIDRSSLTPEELAGLGFSTPKDLGFMLHDLDFSTPADPQPRFFRALLKDGAVVVPAWGSNEVRA